MRWWALWVACGVVSTGAHAAAPPPFYEYVLVLPGKAAPPSLADVREALAASGQGITHHRLAIPDDLRHWDGHGPALVAFEARDLPASALDGARTADTGDDVREQLHLPAGRGAHALAVMIGVPPPRDVPAYAEALRITMAAARRAHAPVAWDGETREFVWIEELDHRLAEAQPPAPGLPARPTPLLAGMGSLDRIEPLPDGGERVEGLRRIGLPDIEIPHWTGRLGEGRLSLAIARLVVSGAVAAAPCTRFALRADSEAFTEAFAPLPGRPGGAAPLAFACEHAARQAPAWAPRALVVTFPRSGGGSDEENHAAVMAALLPTRFTGLAPDRAAAVEAASARARQRFAQLAVRRPDVADARLVAVTDLVDPRTWVEVRGWQADGQGFLGRRLTGDPRHGGEPWRFDPPRIYEGQPVLFSDSDVATGSVEDFLVLDANGHATAGGEAVDLLARERAAAR